MPENEFDIQEKETKQYISVKIGEEKFGIDIGYVDNIVRMQKITRVPKAQKYFKGIINLRGDIVPVMSARIKMGLDDDVYTSSTRIIILKLEEKGEIGLIVRMQKITRVPKAQKYFKGIINLRGDIVPVMSARIKMGLDDDVYTSSTRIIILKLEEKGEIGLIVDEVCEVVTLVVDEIDKPNIDASSTGKELFINGIGKNGDELISLFEIGSIVSDKDAN